MTNKMRPYFLKRYLVPALMAAVIFTAWAVAPTLAVWSLDFIEHKGEEPSRRACDRIVYFGERAIPAIIAGIESHSPWVRGQCYLPVALKEIGGSAHNQLLAAIDQQHDPYVRACLISSLHTAFEDYSRLHIILDDAEQSRLSEWTLTHLAYDVRYRFPEAPLLQTEDRKLNPKFVAYWEERGKHDAQRNIDKPVNR